MSLKENIKNLWLQWHWTMLGLVALLVRYFADWTPQYVEQFYSRGVFVGVRWLFDFSLSWMPFPLLFVFYGLVIYYVLRFLKSLFSRQIPFRKRLVTGFRDVLNFAGCLIFYFLLLWGYNYARPNFAQQMGLTVLKPDSLALRQELEIAANEAINTRKMIEKGPPEEKSGQAISIEGISSDFEDKMRADVSNFLEKNNFKAGGRLRGRQIAPDGTLFRFGISGIYMPFTGESSIDNGTHPLEKPFTMAHEMAHGYGWTEEATANFVAYLTCLNSSDDYTRYSGLIAYYRYVASNYKHINPEAYKNFRANLPEGFRNDLEAINQRIAQYPTWFSTDKLNDIFLKSQGVKEGVDSYARIVVLVYSWRQKNLKLKIKN